MPSPGVKMRINRFWKSCKRLKELSKYSLNQFKSNQDFIDICERNLHIAIEAVIDVGEVIISHMGWRTPRSYRDVIDILWENNIINRLKHDILIDLIKVRNILVHNYVYLPPEKLYETIRDLDILIETMSIFLKYMEENGIDP